MVARGKADNIAKGEDFWRGIGRHPLVISRSSVVGRQEKQNQDPSAARSVAWLSRAPLGMTKSFDEALCRAEALLHPLFGLHLSEFWCRRFATRSYPSTNPALTYWAIEIPSLRDFNSGSGKFRRFA